MYTCIMTGRLGLTIGQRKQSHRQKDHKEIRKRYSKEGKLRKF